MHAEGAGYKDVVGFPDTAACMLKVRFQRRRGTHAEGVGFQDTVVCMLKVRVAPQYIDSHKSFVRHPLYDI
jgi:hypothetical protein